MSQHNFQIVGGDTDSIMFCKPDQSSFTEEEQESLLEEINSLLPPLIKFENDGLYKRVVYLKTKNYIMVDQKGKRTIKGSSLKSSSLEPALKTMLSEMINVVVELEDPKQAMVDIYHKYILMVKNGITDITPWAKKMQLSPTTFNSTRSNETRIVDAIKGSNYGSGDRVYLYTTPYASLRLAEQFDGDYDKDTYYEKVFKITNRFATILPTKEIFPNYKLKKNKGALELL